MGLFAALLTLVGFRVQPTVSVPAGYDLVAACVVFLISSATMVWNDYCDADHDARRGKTFVATHRQVFRRYALGWWVLAILGSFGLLHYGIGPFLLALGMILGGLSYPLTYRYQTLPLVTVAVVTALVVWFPAFLGDADHETLAALAWVTFAFVAAREFYKDGEQAETDRGYKATIGSIPDSPARPILGFQKHFFGVGMLYLAGFALHRFFPYTWLTAVSVVGLILVSFYPQRWRHLLDPAILLFLITGLTGQLT